MSEARAITNLIGNGVATMVVARWEGALDLTRALAVLAEDSDLAAEAPEALADAIEGFAPHARGCRRRGRESRCVVRCQLASRRLKQSKTSPCSSQDGGRRKPA